MGACRTKKLDGSSFAILQQHGKLARFDNTVAEVREAMIKQDKQTKKNLSQKKKTFIQYSSSDIDTHFKK